MTQLRIVFIIGALAMIGINIATMIAKRKFEFAECSAVCGWLSAMLYSMLYFNCL